MLYQEALVFRINRPCALFMRLDVTGIAVVDPPFGKVAEHGTTKLVRVYGRNERLMVPHGSTVQQ